MSISSTTLFTMGAGNMAQALIEPMTGQVDDFYAFTPSVTKAKILAKKMGGVALESLAELKNTAMADEGPDFLFLAFKPQQFHQATADFLEQGFWQNWSKKTTIVSMLAGTPLEVLSKKFQSDQIVRIMPNTPALVGKGITLVLGHSMVDKSSLSKLKSLLREAGPTFECADEEQLDQVTSVTGSGPAYVFEFTRILQENLMQWNIGAKEARQLAVNLVAGSAELMMAQDTELETLRNNVTSKRGVTEAALNKMKELDLEGLMEKALEKNIERSFELRQDALKMD